MANPFDDKSVKEVSNYTGLDGAYSDANTKEELNAFFGSDYTTKPPPTSRVSSSSISNVVKKVPAYEDNFNPNTNVYAQNIPPKTVNFKELDYREENLRRKEQELQQRKQRLDQLEREIEQSGENVRKDNWPCACYPVTYHSITQEIPPHARSHMRKMYFLVLLTFITLFWNLCTEFAIYLTSAGSDTDILWGGVYFVAGIFGSWKLWYRQIYYAIRDHKNIKWWFFFFFFLVHIGFAIVMAIGFQSIGAAGFIQMFDTFNKNSGAGMCNLVSAVLWCIVALISCIYMKTSYNVFKDKGGLASTKEELTKEVIKSVVTQRL